MSSINITTMGIESKNNQKGSVPRDFRLSNSAEVYNCIHTEEWN
jgi:hypothetical protein